MYNMLKIFYVLGTILLLFSGCGKEKTDEERKFKGQQQVSAKNTTTEKSPEPTPFSVYYDIRLLENMLVMYEVTDLGAECINRVKIDESYYPPEDISELKQGIKAYSKEGAYEILENFTN